MPPKVRHVLILFSCSSHASVSGVKNQHCLKRVAINQSQGAWYLGLRSHRLLLVLETGETVWGCSKILPVHMMSGGCPATNITQVVFPPDNNALKHKFGWAYPQRNLGEPSVGTKKVSTRLVELGRLTLSPPMAQGKSGFTWDHMSSTKLGADRHICSEPVVILFNGRLRWLAPLNWNRIFPSIKPKAQEAGAPVPEGHVARYRNPERRAPWFLKEQISQ